jgi:hypothetical protein
MNTKTIAFIIALTILMKINVIAQTMTSIFKLLPAECTPNLNNEQKKTLLKNGSYTMPGGDSTDTQQYTIDTIQSADYLSYVYDHTTGQRGFNVFELKRFNLEAGGYLIVFSRFGGAPVTFSQQDLKIFTFKNNVLIENKKQRLLPRGIKLDEFLAKQTPVDSRKTLNQNYCDAFELKPGKADELEYQISFPMYELKEDEKWVIAEAVVFKWNGHSFDKIFKKKE